MVIMVLPTVEVAMGAIFWATFPATMIFTQPPHDVSTGYFLTLYIITIISDECCGVEANGRFELMKPSSCLPTC
jgi:hypothetical protein